jgi:hypothetical protein
MPGFEPTSITHRFFLVARTLPAWHRWLELLATFDAGLTSGSVVGHSLFDIVDGAESLAAGLANGSVHGIFTNGPLPKGFVKAGF